MSLVPAGIGLIAVTYGLARFAYGLFLPDMREEVGLSAPVAGFIGSASYAGYIVAILVAALLADRLGPRLVAAAAGIVAMVGMALIALSSTPWVLAAAILIAGMSTGLASPPMADAVARTVPFEKQGRANALINSGSSAGVTLSVPIALVAVGHWRTAYLLFALIAAFVTTWIALTAPGRRRARRLAEAGSAPRSTQGSLVRRDALPLAAAAFAIGFASAAYWTFGRELMVLGGGLSAPNSSWAWVIIGLSGFAGGAAGDLIRRFGINPVHLGSLLALAFSTSALALAPESLVLVYASAALFGGSYVMLTGVYLIWGVQVYADRPAVGLALPFLLLAVGQVVGASAAGGLIGAYGHMVAFVVFSLVVLVPTLTAPRCLDVSPPPEPTQAAATARCF